MALLVVDTWVALAGEASITVRGEAQSEQQFQVVVAIVTAVVPMLGPLEVGRAVVGRLGSQARLPEDIVTF